MQRSEVNYYLQHTREFFRQQDVHLPPWADFDVSQWRAQDRDVAQEILALRLGWDLTSFGAADFLQTGLTLFTLRNGSPGGQPWHKPYAEKIMHVREGQQTPMHYHPRKMEDIINRGGGNLIVLRRRFLAEEAFDPLLRGGRPTQFWRGRRRRALKQMQLVHRLACQ